MSINDMELPEFEEECRFIPDNKDDTTAFVQVATITNESERIVRVVAKGLYSLCIEVMYCEIGRYQWHTETVSIGIDELLLMGKVVKTYVEGRERQEKEEEEEVKIKIAKSKSVQDH